MGPRAAYDVLELVGVASGEVTLFVDLALRGAGLVLFTGLLLTNPRRGISRSEPEGSPDAA